MTLPRQRLVCISETPYYHVVSRCVRRSFLCGIDELSGRNYEHRRQWIENRIRLLSSIFAIDICAYAVMANHYHIVVKLSPCQTKDWPTSEVLKRWCTLFKGPLLAQKWIKGETLDDVEKDTVEQMAEVYRKRLTSLSWFMKCLNESIAREANREDDCRGHFWESRFKSQALLTEEALLTCMAYVDLNPIRAGLSDTPESSNHTSIKERIKPSFNADTAAQEQIQLRSLQCFDLPLKPLLRFTDSGSKAPSSEISFLLQDYLALVDYTGRIILPDKHGSIPSHFPGILQRLSIKPDDWMTQVSNFELHYATRHSERCHSQRLKMA
jgi:REP element-mobilizing transposase RayT